MFGAFKALADNFAFTLFGVKPSFHEQDQKFLLSSLVTSHHSIKQTKPKKARRRPEVISTDAAFGACGDNLGLLTALLLSLEYVAASVSVREIP